MLNQLQLRQHSGKGVPIIALLMTLQCAAFVALTIVTIVLSYLSITSAVTKHKATAASLTTAFGAVGTVLFLVAAIFTFVAAYHLWRKQHSYPLWLIVTFEILVFCLHVIGLLTGVWWIGMQAVLAVVIVGTILVWREVRELFP